MLERAFEAGVQASWVAADEVYSGDRRLRMLLEGRRQPFVLTVRRNEMVWAGSNLGPWQVAVAEVASGIAEGNGDG